jgi:hypothetical protein
MAICPVPPDDLLIIETRQSHPIAMRPEYPEPQVEARG